MKKWICFIIICLLIIIAKYNMSDYELYYKIDNYNIKEIYKNKRIYYEISNKKEIYNFDIYTNRKIDKQKISKIRIIENKNESLKCIIPIINKKELKPICSQNKNLLSYDLVNSTNLEKYQNKKIYNYKNDFINRNKISKNEFVAIWNYKGFKILNGNESSEINLFKKESYDNSLSYILKNKIYIANYDEKYEFKKFIILNVENKKIEEFELDDKINFDSYFVGSIKNKLYLYDNKDSILYEIDPKKEKVKIVGSNKLGFKKYEKNNWVSCSKNEYKINKIKYNDLESNYKYSKKDGIIKIYKDNKNIQTKISDKATQIIYEFEDNLYYLNKDKLIRYNTQNGNEELLYNYELKYNNKNTIYIYHN